MAVGQLVATDDPDTFGVQMTWGDPIVLPPHTDGGAVDATWWRSRTCRGSQPSSAATSPSRKRHSPACSADRRLRGQGRDGEGGHRQYRRGNVGPTVEVRVEHHQPVVLDVERAWPSGDHQSADGGLAGNGTNSPVVRSSRPNCCKLQDTMIGSPHGRRARPRSSSSGCPRTPGSEGRRGRSGSPDSEKRASSLVRCPFSRSRRTHRTRPILIQSVTTATPALSDIRFPA